MSSKIQHFSIGQLWDGGALLPSEGVVELCLHSLRDCLLLEVDAPYYGDPAPATPVGSTEGLWNFEVVEWFVVGMPKDGEEEPYLEVELSPHGHSLVLQLEGVRQRVATLEPLEYEVTIANGRWKGLARIPREWLPPLAWKHNAYAIHGVGKERRYLAMTPVPGPHPDFHRLSYFSPLSSRFLRPE